MTISIIFLIIGFVLLVKGADFFVGGSSRIAAALKVPPLIIGLTLVSFGTSAPEASVSIVSAINGLNDMSLGNVVGSNIFNTLLIIGISSLLVPIFIEKSVKKFDIPVMLGVYGTLALFAFVITPLKIDRWEAVVMLVLFAAYLALLLLRAKKSKPQLPLPRKEENNFPVWFSPFMLAVGLCGIIVGGNLVVDSATQIATALGMSQSLVALTIVAVGTSLPELVTSVVAGFKKENDIAIGNIIGSNIFNVIFILGLSAALHPVALAFGAIADIAVLAGSAILLFVISLKGDRCNRVHGALMILLYVLYIAYIIARN